MASLASRLPENAPGDYFVDASCIDCDTCRFVAPSVFTRSDARGRSVVHHQPATPAERRRAALALVACPTSSIGTADKSEVAAAAFAFPEPLSDDVFYCGYASESSFGASSYLIVREGGNVLVDSPRAAKPLLRRIRELGGARFMFLSHRDDVADHAVFARELGCQRILHEADVTSDTRDVEIRISGRAPVDLAPDLKVLPLPGHTRGSAALLHRDTYLFTGDHLAGEDDGTEELAAWRGVCWYSWPEQIRSMESLREHRFSWVLPGHGRRLAAASPDEMQRKLDRLIERMRRAR